jgi:hypothetical protein
MTQKTLTLIFIAVKTSNHASCPISLSLRVSLTVCSKLPPSLTAEERVSVLKTCFDRVYGAAAAVEGDSSPDESPGDVIKSVSVGWGDHMKLILDCLS